MKATRKSINTILCMIAFALVCMIGVSASAASPASLFSTAAVSGGVKITGYSGAEDIIDIPEKIGGKAVVEIGSNFIASAHRGEIYSVVIPRYVTKIDSQAFKGCANLEQVTLGAKVTSIGASAFEGCSSLYSIDYPSSLRTIGSKAFYGCAFSYVTLPGTVESIGDNAYGSMKSLYQITIGNGTKSIGNNICINCYNLARMTVPSSVSSIGATLVPNTDTVLYVYQNSYAMKYANDKNLTNKINYLDNIQPYSLSFKAASKTKRGYVFYAGESMDLSSTLVASPSTHTNAITWSSSNTSVFTVDRYGKITAKAAGTATLVAKATENPTKTTYTKKASVNITVRKAPSKVIITEATQKNNKISAVKTAAKSSHKVAPKKQIILATRTTPAGGAPVTFASSNTKVATISSTKTQKFGNYTYTFCTITGVAEGSAKITAKTYNGKKAVYELRVEAERKAVSNNWKMAKTYTVIKGNALAKSLKTISGMPKNVKFMSSDTAVATVNKDGVVTGKKPGVAIIRAYTDTEKAETSVFVLPTKINVTSANSNTKHKIILKWKKQAGVSGYQIRYKKNGGKWSKNINVSSSKASYTTKALSKGKKYTIQIRGYVKSGKTIKYGNWSASKTLTVK
ncbi:MAG: leucine-rich repeat protein [Eubacteriales bacterium]|nr:leucine-rich repeat protein [Eubacteriales bacterium]